MLYNPLLQLLFIGYCFAEQLAHNFPNPRTNGYYACGLKSRGYVCDPEKVLTEQERYRLNNALLQLSQRTSFKQGDFCAKKGVDATLIITRQGSESLAQQLNVLWNVDGQCKKAVIFVLSINDRRLYYAAEEQADITSQNFVKTVSQHQQLLDQGKYTMALSAIFRQLAEGSESEQAPSTDDQDGMKQNGQGGRDGSSGTKKLSTSTYNSTNGTTFLMIISLTLLPLFLKS